ncbi:methyltransferase [bacterium (Candidatus Blackallbacteria) CG17_big_fil_post_rev_8_21_14_2_50_48_46]|uniref:Methyltransferase n=1 Tax=bacterium (Candidatus Blackallbacteria) CG17_big_fil_post_rev_8_21_14_2_50_48_46 TaxID=2014261 RepID=A0A2M7G9P5_9BACT|nr:MAG: methyltransferase [bacterium (Candidatus Blackallbacteria) CG18_big_fil_WC_8_21_14_2_50_49_26]PIW18821.1 MAG: methyltransferase [bacterium (Candidatus Blackallbacteria) CG17_big_fil_post_rev_8_21_14_2_50_48_46]PIW49276.1 MAG: methyltransferase [bacterium (Candidatus Blackallbacteria) CG13_big_fil_rev_8_21_14_2_50_49_14]
MKTEWNYTELAEAYLQRPDYAKDAVDAMLDFMQIPDNARVCDVGAGVAHLTKLLAQRGYFVDAVEPNDRMRELGTMQTKSFEKVNWYEGTGENTGRTSTAYDLVSFGSSFNVTDRLLTLAETRRILKPGGWFACMWNHRDLEDPIQKGIEKIISEAIPGYDYGTRRENQRDFLEQSGYFEQVFEGEGRIVHQQSLHDCLTAWRSHATLQRQAKENFEQVIAAIENYLKSQVETTLEIPYITRIWYGQIMV